MPRNRPLLRHLPLINRDELCSTSYAFLRFSDHRFGIARFCVFIAALTIGGCDSVAHRNGPRPTLNLEANPPAATAREEVVTTPASLPDNSKAQAVEFF